MSDPRTQRWSREPWAPSEPPRHHADVHISDNALRSGMRATWWLAWALIIAAQLAGHDPLGWAGRGLRTLGVAVWALVAA